MIELLKPVFPGEWAHLAEPLGCGDRPPPGALRVADLVSQPEHLAAVLQRLADHLGCADLRPVASAWSLQYLWLLLPPFTAAASVLQHVLPIDPEAVWLSVDGTGMPVGFHILDEGHARRGTGTADRYGALLWQHLAPLFDALHRSSRVAVKVLWGNAARHLETLFDHAAAMTAQAPPVMADRALLMDACTWPDGRRNPLVDRLRGLPGGAGLYRQCCLVHLFPEGNYCAACPLSVAARQAAVQA